MTNNHEGYGQMLPLQNHDWWPDGTKPVPESMLIIVKLLIWVQEIKYNLGIFIAQIPKQNMFQEACVSRLMYMSDIHS